jgi:predicted kinase
VRRSARDAGAHYGDAVATLLHLDGAPGVGKSTLAARYADEHPGVLCLDVDRLRTMVGGWRDDFVGAGAVVRPLAQALVRTHLDGGRDVVLPQLLADPEERAEFAAVATAAGHDYVRVLLSVGPGVAAARLDARSDDDPVHAAVRAVVAAAGGAEAVADVERRLAAEAADDRDGLVLAADGDPDRTYRDLLALLEHAGTPGG